MLFQGKGCPCCFPSTTPRVAAARPPWHLQCGCSGEEVRLSLPARPPRGAWGGVAVPPHPGGNEATLLPCPGAGASSDKDQISRAPFLRGWIPSSLAPQGMPACSPPTLAARLESPSVSLCSGSAGEVCREDGLHLHCSDTGSFPWAGKVGMGGSFPGSLAALPNPCPPRTTISLAELCKELAQSLAAPASCKVSPGCPCSVPVSPLGVIELSTLHRPCCTTGMGETWLETSATAAPPCLAEHPAAVGEGADGAGEAAQHRTRVGRLCLHCPAAAQGRAGCPFSPERQPVSPRPLPVGTQAALLRQQPAPLNGGWIGTGSLESKGSRGLSQDCSTTAQVASLHFRIKEVCKCKGIASFH